MPVPPAQRLLALDVFRGLTVAAMILVNNAGEPAAVYRPLQHAEWNGCTPTDLIFPFFLFITGIAIPFSLATSTQEPRTLVYTRILRRAAVVFALGIFINGFPAFDWSTLRIPGVLQRIALCYACAGLLAMRLSIPAQILTALLLIVGYGIAMALVPLAWLSPGVADMDTTFASLVDNRLLHGHLLHATWDPEGLLSTAPALATTLCGVLAGHWLRVPRQSHETARGLLVAGVLGLSAGLLLDSWWPINKTLWTGSYVLFSAGAALMVLAACSWLIDVQRYRRWTIPFVAYGTNPIVVYVLSILITKLLYLWRITRPDGSTMNAAQYLFETIFLPYARPIDASLFYALTYTLLWLGVTTFLYRRRVLIKI